MKNKLKTVPFDQLLNNHFGKLALPNEMYLKMNSNWTYWVKQLKKLEKVKI
jgi:hypothetical protein